MYLRHVTITGLDARSDLVRVRDLSDKYPFVEWGILYSPSRAGVENRYMAVNQIVDRLIQLPHSMNFSLHLCGKGVDRFLTSTIAFSYQSFKRIQLNFNIMKPHDWTLEDVIAICKEFPAIQFITQDNHNNRDVFQHLFRQPNHAMLWDASGGTGSTQNILPFDPPRGVFYGFAGGINPENVTQRLLMIIDQFNHEMTTWIDMESGVRTNDWLDLDKVENVLETVSQLNGDWLLI